MASIGYKTHVSEFLEEKQSSFCRVGNGARLPRRLRNGHGLHQLFVCVKVSYR